MKVDYQLHISGLKGLKPFLQNIMLIENYDGMGELDTKEVGETIDLAIEALEKQIPKKPTGDLHSVPHYRCSVCKSGVKQYDDSITYPFCHHCGQALDWSDVT